MLAFMSGNPPWLGKQGANRAMEQGANTSRPVVGGNSS